MKFRLTFKTPDVVDTVIEHELQNVPDIEYTEFRAEMEDVCERFVKHNECITIEFDTVKQTAMVVKL